MKALKVTVSGSYRTANKEVVDFENVTGVIPAVDEELAEMHVRSRYALTWVKNAVDEKKEKLYKPRIARMRQVFVDDIEEVQADFSFVNKDIKEMSYEELQDLATLKDLRRIPLPKESSGISLREMREIAYLQYAKEILRKDYGDKDQDFDYANEPPLIVEGGARKDKSKKITNEEMIEQEQQNSSLSAPKNTLTLDDLKGIAKQKGISHSNNIGFDALYAKLYGEAAA